MEKLLLEKVCCRWMLRAKATVARVEVGEWYNVAHGNRSPRQACQWSPKAQHHEGIRNPYRTKEEDGQRDSNSPGDAATSPTKSVGHLGTGLLQP